MPTLLLPVTSSYKRFRANSVTSPKTTSPTSSSEPHALFARRQVTVAFRSLAREEAEEAGSQDTQDDGYAFFKAARESSPSDVAELCSTLACLETLEDRLDALDMRSLSPVHPHWTTLMVHGEPVGVAKVLRHRRKPTRPLFDSSYEISLQDVFGEQTQPQDPPPPPSSLSSLSHLAMHFPSGGCMCGKHEDLERLWQVHSPTPPPGFDPTSSCCTLPEPDSNDDTVNESLFDA